MQYVLYNKNEYVCTFVSYKEAKRYKTYQLNAYGINLKIKREYV